MCFVSSVPIIIKDSGRRRIWEVGTGGRKPRADWGVGRRKMTTGHAVWAVTQHVNWVELAGHKIPNGALVFSCSPRSRSDLRNQGVRYLRTWTVKAKLECC